MSALPGNAAQGRCTRGGEEWKSTGAGRMSSLGCRAALHAQTGARGRGLNRKVEMQAGVYGAGRHQRAGSSEHRGGGDR